MATQRPNTIVLIHGLWMTPRSWEEWVPYYESKGFEVLAPAWPGLEIEVEALRANTAPIEVLSTEVVAHHLESLIRRLAEPPILMGHSFGGALTQILLDRGLGAAGVAINSVPVKGVLRLPLSTIKAIWPVLAHPANRHKAVPLTPAQFHYAFTNTLTEEESLAVYERYHIPCPGRMAFEGSTANFNPHAATRVDFDREERAPLLFIGGGRDNIMPAKLNRWNLKHYKSGVVAFHEFPERDHFTCGAPGWREVADFALEWAQSPRAADHPLLDAVQTR